MGTNKIDELSLFDFGLVADLPNHKSMRSLARSRRLEAPNLSKIFLRIERKTGFPVVRRSPQGYVITPEGQRLVKIARSVVDAAIQLTDGNAEQGTPTGVISIGASRFISAYTIGPALNRLRTANEVRFRVLDMSPDEVQIAGLSSCEVLVSVGEPQLTRLWSVSPVGDISWGLFASPWHPLPAIASQAEVAKYPFILPSYWRGDRFEIGNDYCPLSIRQRIKGDEASSVVTGAEILKRSLNQLTFGPRLAMKNFVERSEIREIRVRGWKPVVKRIYIGVRSDILSKRMEQDLIGALRENLM